MMKIHTTVLLLAGLVLGGPGTIDPAAAGVPDELRQRVESEGWSQRWHDELYAHEDQTLAAEVRRMLRAKRDEAKLKGGLVVHEWGSMKHQMGTFTSEFDLIREDQSDLPKFVKVWADQPVMVPQVIEKPILYFYTDKPMSVNVRVRFPRGVLTQWYPDVAGFGPQRYHTRPGVALPSKMFRNGYLIWNRVELAPDADASEFAKVDADHPWWHLVRETDATPVRVPAKVTRRHRGLLLPRRPAPAPGNGNGKPQPAPTTPAPPAPPKPTTERFLFYRGAGEFTPTVLPTPSSEFADLSVRVPHTSPKPTDLTGVFLVSVKGSESRIKHAPILRGGSKMTIAATDPQPVEHSAKLAKLRMQESLEAAGLFAKEAAGLVKIWGDDMFTTPGERLLYLMPQHEAEAMLPLQITPKPSDTVRVLIVWVEVSTPQAERQITELVRKLDSIDADERKAAEAELRKLDRFGEAILLRVVRSTDSADARAKIQSILDSLRIQRQQGKRSTAPTTKPPTTVPPGVIQPVPVPLPRIQPAPAPPVPPVPPAPAPAP